MSVYDVAVLGLGAMGSAAAAHLARRGKRVLGLERFALGHDRGASAGRTRVIRKGYFEGPFYVPLLDRAYELWHALERETNADLLDLVGSLMVGRPNGAMYAGVQRCAALGVAIDELDGAALRARFPQLRIEPGECGFYEADAGIVFPERGIDAHLRVAREHGADLRGDAGVRGWFRTASGAIAIETERGGFQAEQLVVCAGPWLGDVAHALGLPLRVQRNVQVWFESRTDAVARGRFPTFFLERDGLPRPLYGFPDLGDGVKAALHGFGEETDADALDRTVHDGDAAAVRGALDTFLPGVAGAKRSGKACMYTLTPDEHFIIDRHPHDDGVVIAGGFSGHGYKFAPVVGEIVAGLVADGTTPHDIGRFRIARFAAAAAPGGSA